VVVESRSGISAWRFNRSVFGPPPPCWPVPCSWKAPQPTKSTRHRMANDAAACLSINLCKELADKMVARASLDGLACISSAEGASERAARLFGAAEVLGEAVGPLTPEEDALRAPYLVMARSQLDEASWRAAWAEGRAMSMDQAIDYALSEEKPTSPISPAPERPSADEAPHLTRREREVAALVAQGFTSRQIASKLVVSERTVDNHVANILKKFSLRSREQIAARMVEQSPRRD
jgi:DNA-binding CsgD family transcriptional regulator